MTSSNYSTLSPAPRVMAASSDVFIISIGVVLAALYLFRDQLFSAKPKTIPLAASKQANGSANPRDFIAKMKEAVSTNLLFFLRDLLSLLNRKNALSYSTARRPVLQKSMPFVLPKKQSRNLGWLLLSATQRSTILKILTNSQTIALPSLSWQHMERVNLPITPFSLCKTSRTHLSSSATENANLRV